MSTFNMTTHWQIPAAIETCWFCILEVKAWPDWWPYVKSVREIAPGDSSGINNIHQYTWRTCLPYQLTFELRVTTIKPFETIGFDVTGNLTGSGYCQFRAKKQYTEILFIWNVDLTVPWMSYAATFAQPVFEWNHRRVMLAGEQSLIRRLKLNS